MTFRGVKTPAPPTRCDLLPSWGINLNKLICRYKYYRGRAVLVSLDVLIGRYPAKKPPPLIFARILNFKCVFLAFILSFCLWVPWTVRSEAELTWSVRSKSATCLPRVNSRGHKKTHGPIRVWHVVVGDMWTNQVTTRVKFCHMACHVGLKTTSTNQRSTRVICATWQSGPLP
jgi:hypothetical protein